jgi:hypothetical protein
VILNWRDAAARRSIGETGSELTIVDVLVGERPRNRLTPGHFRSIGSPFATYVLQAATAATFLVALPVFSPE